MFFPLSIRSDEGHGAFIKVFLFNLEESKGHFILGRATKNFKENDNTFKFTKHVSTETSVIFS